MSKINLFSMRNAAYSTYLSTYKGWRDWSEKLGINCLEPESSYTFADDMVVYLINEKTSCDEIDKYIKRMLKRFCNGKKQGYYEMILATMVMSNVFFHYGFEKESKLCADWYSNLFFNETYYKRYAISESEMSDMLRLR